MRRGKWSLGRPALPALFLALASGCDGSTDPINVSGTWTGTLAITIAGSAQTTPLTLTLTQSGNTVNGSLLFTASSRKFTLEGTLEGRTLDVTARPVISFVDDCINHTMDIVLSVSLNVMTATGAGGLSCTGIMIDGHSTTETVTAASGTLTRS